MQDMQGELVRLESQRQLHMYYDGFLPVVYAATGKTVKCFALALIAWL